MRVYTLLSRGHVFLSRTHTTEWFLKFPFIQRKVEPKNGDKKKSANTAHTDSPFYILGMRFIPHVRGCSFIWQERGWCIDVLLFGVLNMCDVLHVKQR